MKTTFIAAFLVASSTALPMPAFAGDYGNVHAVHDDHADGSASSSQPVQTAHRAHAKAASGNQGDVGGDDTVRTQSGRRAPTDSIDAMYRGG